MSQLTASLARAIADHQGWPADWEVNAKHLDLAGVMFAWMEKVLWPGEAPAHSTKALSAPGDDAPANPATDDADDEIDPALWRDRDFEDTIDYLAEQAPGFFTDTPAPGREIVIGTNADDEEVRLDLDASHLLVAGHAGVGKTDLLRTLVAGASERGDHVQVISPCRPQEFDPFTGSIPPVAESLDDIRFVLTEMVDVLDARSAAIAAAGGTTYRDLPQPPAPVLLVVDDCPVLFMHDPTLRAGVSAEQDRERENALAVNAAKDAIIDKIGYLLTHGRAAGYSVALATQHVSGSVLRGLPSTDGLARVLLGNSSRIERIAALRTGLASSEEKFGRGEGIFETGDGDATRFTSRHLALLDTNSHPEDGARA